MLTRVVEPFSAESWLLRTSFVVAPEQATNANEDGAWAAAHRAGWAWLLRSRRDTSTRARRWTERIHCRTSTPWLHFADTPDGGTYRIALRPRRTGARSPVPPLPRVKAVRTRAGRTGRSGGGRSGPVSACQGSRVRNR